MKSSNYIDNNVIILFVLLIAVFSIMLYLNVNTGFIADDYTYAFDFSSGCKERITRVSQIYTSMYYHRYDEGGELLLISLFSCFYCFLLLYSMLLIQ